MIAQLVGTVAQVSATSIVVDVGGVGMSVQSTPRTTAQWHAGQQVTLWTHLVVREDSLTLFGFATQGERDAFITLQNVQGVGPRLALAMLSVHGPEQLAAAVAQGDRGALEQVPGIGAKVAARLLLELGGKLDVTTQVAPGDAKGQVVEALESLGWSAKAAHDAVATVTEGPVSEADVPVVLKTALQQMGAARAQR